MSDIVINEKNLSRFAKRLQKSLKNKFQQEVPLNLASLILAETFGVDTIHHLQQKLNEKEIKKNDEDIVDEFIKNYFDTNKNSKILSFSFFKDGENKCFNLTAKSKKYDDCEGFGIYFGWDCGAVKKELINLDLKNEDVFFINQLVNLLKFDSMPENIYLGEKLSVKYNLNKLDCGQYGFKLDNEYESIANYEYCEKKYAIIDGDFFEKIGAPFVFNNDHYSFFKLENNNNCFLNSIEDGLKELKKNQILIEFLTPIEIEKYKKEGVGRFYIYINENNEKIATTVNSNKKEKIKNINDFYYFMGKVYFNINMLEENLKTNIYINEKYRNEIISGFNSCKLKPEKIAKNK